MYVNQIPSKQIRRFKERLGLSLLYTLIKNYNLAMNLAYSINLHSICLNVIALAIQLFIFSITKKIVKEEEKTTKKISTEGISSLVHTKCYKEILKYVKISWIVDIITLLMEIYNMETMFSIFTVIGTYITVYCIITDVNHIMFSCDGIFTLKQKLLYKLYHMNDD